MNSQDYSPSDNLVIATPIEQTFVHCGSKSSGGVFEARNIKKYSQVGTKFILNRVLLIYKECLTKRCLAIQTIKH